MSSKIKRIVLGEGHPWYSSAMKSSGYDTVQLTVEPVAPLIIARGKENLVKIKYAGTGNWNRVRLVLEVLE